MTSEEMVKSAVAAIKDKKGEQIKIIDIRGISVIADYFIIASGNNIIQTQAIADEIERRFTESGREPKDVEGYRSGSWILLDYADIVIHIFNQKDRRFYNLERIWMDGKQIEDADSL